MPQTQNCNSCLSLVQSCFNKDPESNCGNTRNVLNCAKPVPFQPSQVSSSLPTPPKTNDKPEADPPKLWPYLQAENHQKSYHWLQSALTKCPSILSAVPQVSPPKTSQTRVPAPPGFFQVPPGPQTAARPAMPAPSTRTSGNQQRQRHVYPTKQRISPLEGHDGSCGSNCKQMGD